MYLYHPGGLDVGYPVFIVLLYARCYGEDIGVKDDVIGVKVQPVHQQVIGTLADGYFILTGRGLNNKQ